MENKKILYLVQSTDATVHLFKKNGIWERQKSTIEFYAQFFTVYYYTSDWENCQNDMPPNTYHKVGRLRTNVFGLRHILFYGYLVLSAISWRRKNAVIRVFGVTIPVLNIMKANAGKKMVISYQYDWAEQTRKNYRNIKHYVSRWIEKTAIDSADFVLCTMQWLYKKAIDFYKKPSNQCTVIPNYVDLDHFYPEQKEKLIVFAGRLHWSKGVNTLIESFNEYCKSDTTYRLLIFGGGEDDQQLKQQAAGNSLIEFKGAAPINTYATVLRKAEVFVLPTVTMEGHPKALIEAMAAGCKCIASDVAGNIDVLTECGHIEGLFKAGNAEQLLEKLKSINTLSIDKTYNFAVQHYSRTVLLQKECEILNSLVK